MDVGLCLQPTKVVVCARIRTAIVRHRQPLAILVVGPGDGVDGAAGGTRLPDFGMQQAVGVVGVLLEAAVAVGVGFDAAGVGVGPSARVAERVDFLNLLIGEKGKISLIQNVPNGINLTCNLLVSQGFS
jgi:hypothetical protein